MTMYDESANLLSRALLEFESVLTSTICSSLEAGVYEQMIAFHQAWDNASLVLGGSYFLAR